MKTNMLRRSTLAILGTFSKSRAETGYIRTSRVLQFIGGRLLGRKRASITGESG
jgi:hypothetical protein